MMGESLSFIDRVGFISLLFNTVSLHDGGRGAFDLIIKSNLGFLHTTANLSKLVSMLIYEVQFEALECTNILSLVDLSVFHPITSSHSYHLCAGTRSELV